MAAHHQRSPSSALSNAALTLPSSSSSSSTSSASSTSSTNVRATVTPPMTIPSSSSMPMPNGVPVRRSSLPAGGLFPVSPTSSPPASPLLRASPISAAIAASNTATNNNGSSSGSNTSAYNFPRSPSASAVSHHSRVHSAVLGPLASSAFVWPTPSVHVIGSGNSNGNGDVPHTPTSRLSVNPSSPSLVPPPVTQRHQTPTYDDPMRIAFIGPRDSGKTTFIKSFVSGSWTHDCPSLPSLLTAKAGDTVELKCAFWRTGDGRPGLGHTMTMNGTSMPSTPSTVGMSSSLWDASSRNAARSERLCEVTLIDPARNFRSEADEASWAAQAEGIVFMIHWRQLGQVPTVYFQDYRGQIAAARHEAALAKSGKKPKNKRGSGKNGMNGHHSSNGTVMNGDGAMDVSDAAGDGSTIPCVIVVTKCDQFLSNDLWAESDAGWLAVLRPSSVERFKALLADTTALTRDICEIILSCLHIAAVPPETTVKLTEARHMATHIDAGFFITSAKSRMMVFSAISDLATRIEGRRRQARLHGHSHSNGTAGGGMVTNDSTDSKKCTLQ